MTSSELREKFISFFELKGHVRIPSASLIPENDPSVLFTTAGMHPLVPYLLGETHPAGTRLVNAQKCIRTTDIEEVGDNRHLTFFEMLGNWSLGDYFKKDAINWSYEFLTHEKYLGLDSGKLAISVFGGDIDALRDEESAELWRALGIQESRIAFLPKDDNWWPAGGKHHGPQGPDTEMFYWTGDTAAPHTFDPSNVLWVEIWNNVFMQFTKENADAKMTPLLKKNVDTGMGLERILAVVNGAATVFDTDLFAPLFLKLKNLGAPNYQKADDAEKRSLRIIADHIKAATFIVGDTHGVLPSNVDQGYVARRLLRRAIRLWQRFNVPSTVCDTLAEVVIVLYKDIYPELLHNKEKIVASFNAEEKKFTHTLEKGMVEFEKIAQNATGIFSGKDAFTLFSSYGFPFELSKELAKERNLLLEEGVFEDEFKKHQQMSREGAAQKFAGGLADPHDPKVIAGHTATHLLQQALRTVLGLHVAQKGSNITSERVRFDFSHNAKMTAHELEKVSSLVNAQIKKNLPVHFEMMSSEKAKKAGAIGLFDDAYAQIGGQVKVYFVGNDTQGFFSKEICGGPHVNTTGEIGSFKIIKEEAVAAGIRRIKAVVE